jgi:hypothetical protein
MGGSTNQSNTVERDSGLLTTTPAGWTRRVDLVFLVGSPRSGTTWLQAMLAGHPGVYTGPETHFFELFDRVGDKFAKLTKPNRHGMARYWSDDLFYHWMADLFRGAISALPPPQNLPAVFLEKTPAHCLHAPFIIEVFPQARFIHLVRDGRAVVASLLRLAGGKSNGWAPNRVSKAVDMWKRCVLAGQRIPSLLSDPSQFVELRYEQLRRDPLDHVSRLFSWMGLKADPALVRSIVEANALENVLKSDERFPTITRVMPEEKKFRDRFFGSAAVSADEIELSRWQRARVEMRARGLLRKLGYLG